MSTELFLLIFGFWVGLIFLFWIFIPKWFLALFYFFTKPRFSSPRLSSRSRFKIFKL